MEGASDAYETVWNNQWEPSTVRQDASLVYRARFGSKGHSNVDINIERDSENILELMHLSRKSNSILILFNNQIF